MKRTTAIAVAALTALAAPAWAQKGADDHSTHHAGAQKKAAPLAEGEVRKIDKAGKKITLKHGPIPNIDMPAMTMEFAVKDAALLNKAKPGQKVRFQAELINGETTVTQLEPVK